MVHQTFYRLAEEKRTRILSSAHREFAQHIYEKSSINRILDDAKVPKGSFYQYFDDKSDLFYLCMYAVYEKILKARAEKGESLIGTGMLRMKQLGYEKGYQFFSEDLHTFLGEDDFQLFTNMLEAPPAIRNYVQMSIASELIAPAFAAELRADPDVREDADISYYAYLLSLTEVVPVDYGARNGCTVEETIRLGFEYMQALYNAILK